MAALSEIVLFGIRAGIKLGKQGRLAYIEKTINKTLVVPLPSFDSAFSIGSAENYFRGEGKNHLKEDDSLKALFDRFRQGQASPGEKESLRLAALKCKVLDNRNEFGEDHFHQGLTPESFKAIVHVHQFVNERDDTPGLQRVLGTVIESGVDLFNQFPGIISDRTAAGRALSGFLESIDSLKFSEQRVDMLARDFFVAAVETIHTNTDLLGADDKTENLIRSVSVGLVEDVQNRLSSLVAGEQGEVETWGQLVLRSVISNAGQTVLSNPKSLGFDTPGGQALISSVGTAILDVILDESINDASGQPVRLRALFSRQALDAVVHASMKAIADHPDLFGDTSEGLKHLIQQIASSLPGALQNQDILPELIRLVIEKTALNVDVLWPDRFQADSRHLLVTASSVLLNQLADVPQDGTAWRPSFTRSQLGFLLNTVLDEVVQNPDWVLKSANGSPMLQEALQATLRSLQRVEGNRLTAETGLLILSTVVKTVGLRREFLALIPVEGEDRQALFVLLESLIDAVFTREKDLKLQWTLARGEVFSQVVEAAMNRLAVIGITEENIQKVLDTIEQARQMLKAGGTWSLQKLLDRIANLTASAFANPEQLGIDHPLTQSIVRSIGASLEEATENGQGVDFRALIDRDALDRIVTASLSAIAEHPDLFGTGHEGLQRIISQTASSLTPSMLERGMLPNVLQLVLDRTARNVELLWPDRFETDSRHLLVTASALVLNQLAAPPKAGATWKPVFSISQLKNILEAVLDEVMQNPGLILQVSTTPSILQEAIQVALDTLQDAPANRLSAETARDVLEAVVRAVALRPQFLERVQEGVAQTTRLAQVLNHLIDLILSGDLDRIVLATLARGEYFSQIVSAVLDRLAHIGITDDTVEAIVNIIKHARKALSDGKEWNLAGLLSLIQAVTTNNNQ